MSHRILPHRMVFKNILRVFLASVLFFFISTLNPAYSYDFNITSKNADSAIQKLSQKEDKTADDYLTLGWAYYAFKNNIEEGAINLERALEQNPNLYEANFLLGLLYKSKGEYKKAFSYWLRCLDFDRIENALLNHDILTLNLSISKIKEVIAKYEFLISSSKNELVIPHALYCLAGEYGVLGEVDKAKETYEKLGLIKDWLVIGPFDNKEKIGFNTAYPPETEIDLTKTYDGKLRKVGWRKLIGVELAQTVDFDSIFYPNEWTVGYALTYVHSDKEQDAAIKVGSDDAVKVWFNDKLIIQNNKYQAFILDQNETGVILRKGWNKLLVKVCEGGVDWRFGLRITDVNGHPMEGLKYSVEPQSYISDTGLLSYFEKSPAIKTIKNVLKDKIKKNPTDYITAYTLAEWLRLLDLKRESMDEFESLIQQEGHCAIFRFGLANIESNYGDKEKSLANYKETIIENPEHLEALIEIAYRFYSNNRNEQALQYVDKAKKISPDYMENYILTSLIYSDKRWDKDAYDEARAGLSSYPESTRMLYRVASCAMDIFRVDEAIECYERIMQLNKWLRPDSYSEALMIYTMRGQPSEIEKIYSDRMAYYTFDSSFYSGLVYGAMVAGDYQKAIEYCDKASLISPENYKIYENKGDAYYYLGKTEEALSEWDKSMKMEPSNAALRDKITFVRRKEKSLFDRYTETQESIQILLETNDASEKYAGENAAVLFDKRIYNVHDDGSCEVMVYVLVEILNTEGIDKYSKITFPDWGNVKIKKAVVINPGKTDTEITQIDFRKGLMYPPDLKVGSIIEYKYSYDSSGGLLEGHFYSNFLFKEITPVSRKEIIVIMPGDKVLNIYTRGEEIQYRTETFQDKRIYIWRADNIDPIKIETFMPSIGKITPFVAVSDISSWAYLANWENNLIDDQLEIDAAIKAEIERLTKGKDTQEEKVRAIHDYVTKKIHYLALKHDVFGWKPNRATKIFKDQYGDCKDMAILIIAMLKEIGMDAYFTILFTRPLNMSIEDIAIPIANHGIVYVPEIDGREGLFIDATASKYNYGTLPYTDEGVMAIILKRPGYEIAQILESKAKDNTRYVKIHCTLQKDEQMAFNFAADYYGQHAGEMRYQASKDEWDEWVEKGLNMMIPGLSSLKIQTENSEDLGKPFILHAEFTAPNPLKKRGSQQYEMSPIDEFKLVERYASTENRHNDMDLGYACSGSTEESFTIPEGFEVLSIPEEVTIDNTFIFYQCSYLLEGNIVKSKRDFSIKNALIKKEEYPKFRENLIAIDKLDKRKIVFKDTKNIL